MSKIKQFAVAHKIITAIILVAVAWGGYTVYGAMNKPVAVTKYVIQNATQGTVIASVSGSGQVQSATTVDVKPQVSETVTKIYVQPGDHVAAGQVLMQLDITNEQKAVTQAQLSLQSSQISLAKLQEVTTSSLLQDENSVTTDEQNLLNASTSLAKDYQSGFDTLSNAFVDLQTLMTNLNDFMIGTQISKTQDNPDAYVNLMPSNLQPTTLPYKNELIAAYNAAVTTYQQNLTDYHAANRDSPSATLDSLFAETYNTTKQIADAVKAGQDLLDYVVDNYPSGGAYSALPTITTTYQTDFGNYTTSISSDLSSVSGIITTITNDEQSLTNGQSSLVQASTTYNELIAGPDPLDVQSQNISIENSQMSLQTAEQNLGYDSVRAPIAGIVATVPSVVGETVASPAATIVSDGEIAQLTLNEVDAAKMALGDKATLTFDAFPNLSLAGTVVELDPVGTVSQGVVNYNVQIGFTQPADTSSSEMVKPGMSVTAAIVTQADQNVIAVPNAAVHTAAGASYVLEPATPVSATDLAASATGGILLTGGTKMVPVTIGITNDTLTEIASGVNLGDQIITQSITTSASTATTAAGGTSAFSALTGGARTGGAAAGGFGGGGGTRTFTTGGTGG
jgi:multidrug efflux pump subunit AcrA (membrane-fusion protein)